MADMVNTCPACGAEESLDALLHRMIDDDEVRRLIAQVVTQSLPLGGLVVRYLRLHKPPKQKLRMSTIQKLLAELVPDVQRSSIERTGRVWAVTLDGWRAAFQAVFDAADKGTLNLPLQGNGYLYSVLVRMADQAEGRAEAQREADRRSAPRQDTVQVRGEAMTIGDALAVVHGGRDPALVKVEADARNASPMPDEVRQRIAELRGGTPTAQPKDTTTT
jgi:hypothetical protein